MFDLVRLALDDLEAALRIHESEARQQIDVATIRMSTGIGSTLLIVFLLFLLVWRSLRKQVIEPLERLGADAREVSGGDLSHRIEGTGPPDFLALAGDIEAMRARILAQLATVEEAGRQLDARNQDLARSNIELEQFAYVASHDLQEPLRKVASFCQLLQRRYEGQLDDRADQYIGFAVDGAKRMQALINDLLAFSRVGRTTRAFRPIALAEVVDAALVNLAVTVESAGGTVEVGDLPVVLGDPILLTAVFQNLIGNSMKFRGEDPPVVSIEAEASGDGWLVSVEDDGIGIEPRFAERVFVIFQRLHAREEFEGTGIGLALCRKIVEHHGGRIWIDGENPVGTRVMFTLPVNPP